MDPEIIKAFSKRSFQHHVSCSESTIFGLYGLRFQIRPLVAFVVLLIRVRRGLAKAMGEALLEQFWPSLCNQGSEGPPHRIP